MFSSLLVLLGLASAGVMAAPPAQPPAAVVNGVSLEVWEVERELAQRVTSSMFHRRIPPDRMREFRQESLSALVLKELKRQRAKAREIQVDRGQIDVAWREVRDRFESGAAYLDALEKKGITDEAFRRSFERDAVAEAVDRLIQNRVEVPSVEDVVFHYLNHKADYTMPESRHVIHLLLYISPGASAAEREKAQKRAAQILEEARSGIPLVDLVEQAAKGLPPKYRDQVGDLGFVHRGTLVGGLDDAVFSAPVGKVVGPEKSLFGFHIFKVIEARAGRLLPFEEVQEAVAASLEREGRAEGLRIFETGLLEGAQIEIGEWVEQPE